MLNTGLSDWSHGLRLVSVGFQVPAADKSQVIKINVFTFPQPLDLLVLNVGNGLLEVAGTIMVIMDRSLTPVKRTSQDAVPGNRYVGTRKVIMENAGFNWKFIYKGFRLPRLSTEGQCLGSKEAWGRMVIRWLAEILIAYRTNSDKIRIVVGQFPLVHVTFPSTYQVLLVDTF